MIPAVAALAARVGGTKILSAVGNALFGSALKATLTGVGIGQMLSSRAPQAQQQVQQNRS